MFDITSSKLLLLAIVALLVIGPKDFPVLLRTIGKYLGIIRGHAKEFRAQFDEAIRESELAQVKTDMESLARETEESFHATRTSVETSFDDARRGVEGSLGADPLAHDADAVPASPPQPAPAQGAAGGADGAASAPDASPSPEEPAPEEPEAPRTAGGQPVAEAPPAPAPAAEKAGA